MASRRRFGGFGRRRSGRRNRPRWTAQVFNLNPAAGALASVDVLSEVQFGTSTTLESECLVHRVILSGIVIASVAGLATVGVGLVKRNENVAPTFAAVYDPNLQDSLVDDDWMYVEDASVFNIAGTGMENFRLYKDIRVKRKLIGTDRLSFIVSNAAGGVACSSVFLARILLTPRL